MTAIFRILGVIAAGFVGLLRTWYRAVLLAPEVKRRKAARRAIRQRSRPY